MKIIRFFKGSKIIPLKKDKITLNKILNLQEGVSETLTPCKITLNEILNLQGVNETFTPCKFNENELNTIFISEAGLYKLIFGSKKEEADEFQQFIFDELLPKLRKNGYYSLSDDIVKDTSASISYFDTCNISTFKNVPVIYIGAIGVYQEKLLYKFGYTSNIEEMLNKKYIMNNIIHYIKYDIKKSVLYNSING
ncbi:Bro-N domain-containing antirepressor protein [Bodo saltans virus]|uniref:Bro-N domain-containing antirepressor protein n=1 Tax=Bodo saltans virus TaxID=2024608 RepID=A0A2H4UTT1_9VIRU|nr:Bro-N domain-containing antirepressor protein [Bodo saltans virus]ATZ80274.1 Bro-N domain-containing antirepressor protein [Bodo saltans virus]